MVIPDPEACSLLSNCSNSDAASPYLPYLVMHSVDRSSR
jgi:hypothetical protein